VDAGEPRLAGFVEWVSPGQHTVTFAPGTSQQEAKTVEVRAGEIVEIHPTAAPTAPPPAENASAPPPVFVAPPTVLSTRLETDHPFSALLVVASGGLTLAASVVAVPLEIHAWTLYNRYGAPNYPRTDADTREFENARTGAHLALGSAIGLAVVTAGLVTWYFGGTRTREVVVTPAGVAGRF
jgi:hypothetical protein